MTIPNTSYTVDGRTVSREAALLAWMTRDPEGINSGEIFDKAHETTTMGYVAREYLEDQGVTLRHAFEEQARVRRAA